MSSSATIPEASSYSRWEQILTEGQCEESSRLGNEYPVLNEMFPSNLSPNNSGNPVEKERDILEDPEGLETPRK